MIVDDEEIVRRGLSNRVPWKSLDMIPAHTAANGRDALTILESSHVDIVITDILMPAMDGLDLIAASAELSECPRFVVLSGYSEFEFARRAMSYGVRHYVLKPSKLPLIVKALEELRDEILSDREMASMPDLSLLHDATVRSIFSGKLFNTMDGSATLNRLGVRGTDSVQVILADLGAPVTLQRVSAVQSIADRVLIEYRVLGAIEAQNAVALLIVAGSPRTPSGLQQFELLSSELKKFGTPKQAVVVSDSVSLDRVPEIYAGFLNYVCGHFYLAGNMVCRYDDHPWVYSLEISDGLSVAQRALERSLEQGDADLARAELEALLLRASMDRVHPESLRSLVATVIERVQRSIDLGPDLSGSQTLHSLTDVSDLHQFRDFVSEIIEHVCSATIVLTHSPQRRNVMAIQDAVNRRFPEKGLSLKKISETEVFANPDYLSRIFHAELGMKFSDYLTQTRMIEAARLLSSYPEMKIQTVSHKVGYGDNSQYFSQLFRQEFGRTPSEFRTSDVSSGT